MPRKYLVAAFSSCILSHTVLSHGGNCYYINTVSFIPPRIPGKSVGSEYCYPHPSRQETWCQPPDIFYVPGPRCSLGAQLGRPPGTSASSAQGHPRASCTISHPPPTTHLFRPQVDDKIPGYPFKIRWKVRSSPSQATQTILSVTQGLILQRHHEGNL